MVSRLSITGFLRRRLACARAAPSATGSGVTLTRRSSSASSPGGGGSGKASVS